ncbi:MAG TPA: pyrimidine dimer DNA glycosylase/endonuclease V [Spirochaetia bacterium]|nr:pyrimidine dimer DNA glycosylase/endonuclease V [Spirochaetia bacterium]
MRLWSLHPKYLDAKGLVAAWREGLLALEVLKGNTRGYRNHPQLVRFKATSNPVQTITCYLWHLHRESESRGYRFDSSKLDAAVPCGLLEVTRGQLVYEMGHLKAKLERRTPQRLQMVTRVEMPDPHPLFTIVPGGRADWEAPSR